MSKVIIVGGGPAGISAALYTTRAGLETVVITRDGGSLYKADKIENYYGFEKPVSGKELIEDGISQAKRLGAKILNDEVVSVAYNGKIVVRTKERDLTADSVILATGSTRNTPRIKGLKDYEGRGVSYCAACDAFFFRGKDVAVLGDGEYAVHEALELMQTSKSVTLLTNGKNPTTVIPTDIEVNFKEIEEFSGENGMLEKVIFKDGTYLETAGVFIALGVAGSSDLARKLGAQIDGTKIIVDENMATSVPGLYAAGDCTGGMLQVSKAVYEGAKAGSEAIKYIRDLNRAEGLWFI